MNQAFVNTLPAQRLGEINLLLDVLGDSSMNIEAAKQRVLEMAGRTDQLPSPDSYIHIGLELSLIILSALEIRLTPIGKRVRESKDPKIHDRLSNEQAQILMPEILESPEFQPSIDAAMKLLRIWADGTRRIQIGQELSPNEEYGLSILQELWLLKYTVENGERYLTMNVIDAHRLQEYSIESTPTTEEELWTSLDAQRERGKAAEIFVLEFEKERLRAASQFGLSELVERVSERDVGAGYDILSFDANGDTRYIEVKSSTARNIRFFWSIGERMQAEGLGNAFWIYFVPRAHELSTSSTEITMINDPFSRVGHDLFETAVNFEVKMLRNDE